MMWKWGWGNSYWGLGILNEQDMTSEMEHGAAPAAAWPLLTPVEVRVLGCLIEKAATTPEYYPLTRNALVNACNQKSNRDPVMSLTEDDVEGALDALRHTHRLAALVHTAGSRSEKFKHTLTVRIPVNREQAAVLCELFLRGPETVGEVRTRASRLCPFEKLDDVQRTLDELAHHADGALAVKLPREPGRREARWMHVLAGTPAFDAVEPSAPAEPEPVVSDLEDEVRRLRAELDELKTAFAELKRQFE